MKKRAILLMILILGCLLPTGVGAADEKPAVPAQPQSLRSAPWSDPAFFPICVWLQSPANVERYRAAGINTYVALWKGPTEDQLAALKKAGMKLICHQNSAAMAHRDEGVIIGWMHGDEPDNAQSLGQGKGYGPPIAPEEIVKDYERIRAADPSHPVLLNLGQGVAWDGWHGRGVRTNHPEDYPKYIEGCDIVSFDIYPAVHDKPEVAGNLWYVARGVERLVNWSGGRKVVWNCLECTRISNENRKPTPREVKAEAWMSLIHGSRGLIYFVHQFKPNFREAALLDDSEMVAAVTALNRQLTELAPVLNRQDVKGASVKVEAPEVPVAFMQKRYGQTNYLFAVAMRPGKTSASFKVQNERATGGLEVLGEDRTLQMQNGTFKDSFRPWDVHLYRWTE